MHARLSAACVLGALLLALPYAAIGQEKVPADKAILVVKLPANAKLTIDGEKTTSTGSVRRFSASGLQVGKRYYYILFAKWEDDGKEKTKEQKVTFSAGETKEVVFGPGAVEPPKEKDKKTDKDVKKDDKDKKDKDKKDKDKKDKDKKDKDVKKDDKDKKDKDKAKKEEEQKRKAYKAAMEKGDAAMEEKKYEAAIKAYDEALKAKPKDPEAEMAKKEAQVKLTKKKNDEKKKKDDEKKKKDEEEKKKDKNGKDKEKLPQPKVEKDKKEKDKGKEESQAKARTFEFRYAATVAGLEKGTKAKVWLPVAHTTDDQKVELIGRTVASGDDAEGKLTTESRYGNRMFFVETAANDEGKINVQLSYRVTRREVKGHTRLADGEKPESFLKPDALVPIDGKPLELIKGKQLPDDPMKKARVLYDTVNDHMKYSKQGKGWGRGDSAWACDSKFGNCSDFHSLFISLARSQKLPAKFEMGFPIPEKHGEGAVGGYHCWAFFQPEGGKEWVPVDISEANKEPKMKDYYFGNLTPDRVSFSTGRDIDLEPKQSGKPVNFLVYPYVEVGGKEYDQAKIEKKFTYKDVK